MSEQQPQFLNINKLGGIDLANCDLHLRSFSGYEELSRLFLFNLQLDLPVDKVSELSAEKVLGSRIVFSVDHGQPRFFSGVVSEFALGNVDPEGRRDCVIQVVPELWKLTQMHTTRRFPGNTIAELAAQVFDEAELDVDIEDRIDTDANLHPPRSNPIQYDETTLNFLARHFEEESIFYYSRDNYTLSDGSVSGNQVLVLGDGLDDYYKLQVDDGDGEKPLELIFQMSGNVFSIHLVTDWLRQFNFRPATWAINDYDFHKSRDFNMSKSADSDSKAIYRKYKKSAGFYNKDYGDHLLNNLMNKEAAQREYIQSRSSCPYLFPGGRFTLTNHLAEEENGDYIVTSIQHHAVAYGRSEIDRFEYENTFTCIPADRVAVTCPRGTSNAPAGSVRTSALTGPGTPFHLRGSVGAAAVDTPINTSARNTGGGTSAEPLASNVVAETAFVCNKQGLFDDTVEGTIVTDPAGFERVLIRFPWESQVEWQASHGGLESTWRWVRTTQPFAGKQWGMKFLPRVGEEVLIVYIDGNVKKPMIVGSVYNDTFLHDGDQPTSMEQVKTREYFGGGWSEQIPPKVAKAGVSTSPEAHLLAEGKDAARRCPQLSDDDVSGLRTRTITQTGAQASTGNQLLFKDTAGSEEIYIHAQNDFNLNVLGNMNVSIGGDKKEYIHGDYFRVVQCTTSSSNSGLSGPVNRSVSEALTWDLDATWGYTTFRAGDPVTVIVEEYLATETRTHGNNKNEHQGNEKNYFYGDTLNMTTGVTTSTYLGAQFEFALAFNLYVGAALDVYIKLGAEIGYNISPKFTREDSFGIAKETMNLKDQGLIIENKVTALEKAKINMEDFGVHLEKAKLNMIQARTELRESNFAISKSQTSMYKAQIHMFNGMMLFT